MNQPQYGKDFIMKPKIDFAFKEIMMNDTALTGFLSAVLDIPPESIKKLIRKNTNLQKVHAEEKQSILDVRLVMLDDKGKQREIDIEIQLSYMTAWADRSVFYVGKMLVEQVDINKHYSNIKKCIGINILNFKYIHDEPRFHTVYHISEDTSHKVYTDVMQWHLIELPKLPEETDGTPLDKWARFINAEERSELEMIAKGNQYLESALETLEIISQDEQKRLAYTARMTALYDYNTRMEENYNRGKAQMLTAAQKAAQDMNLSEEQIQELLRRMSENSNQ